MFAAIYRGFVSPEREAIYRESWKTVANYFVTECGALGSTLHKTADGEFIAYSRWPSQETRDKVWKNESAELPDKVRQAIDSLEKSIDSCNPRDEICLELLEEIAPSFS